MDYSQHIALLLTCDDLIKVAMEHVTVYCNT